MTTNKGNVEESLNRLFEQWSGEAVGEMMALTANGSNRNYWRIIGTKHRCIAAYNADVDENEAFFYYSQALKQRGINVPELYAIGDDRTIYLQQDLGDTTLYNLLFDKRRQGVGFDN